MLNNVFPSKNPSDVTGIRRILFFFAFYIPCFSAPPSPDISFKKSPKIRESNACFDGIYAAFRPSLGLLAGPYPWPWQFDP